MKHRRIHIIGGPGSGKSSVARSLSSLLSIPMYDLDDIYWDRRANDYKTKASEYERDQALEKILKSESWIVEGVYYRWLTTAFKLADVIVILRAPRWLRHWRIHKRFIKRKLGMIPSKHETLFDFWQLVKWNHKFDHDNLVRIREFILEHCQKTVECRSLAQVVSALRDR